mgnify:CR=1 FL=1
MDWLELKIDTSHAGLDAVTDMLEQQGVTGVMIDDEADFQSFLENNRQYWDYVDDDLLAQKKGVSRVTFYLERNEDAYGTVAAVRMAMSALKKEQRQSIRKKLEQAKERVAKHREITKEKTKDRGQVR